MSDQTDAVSSRIKIYVVRGQQVIMDSDLAQLYEVTTGNLNKAIRRNLDRFPSDFSFILELKEFTDLIFQTGRSSTHGGRRKPPRVFTEHGAIMAATVLNSQRAAQMSIYVVRAFIRIRQELLARTELEKRLAEIEKTLISHNTALRELYEKIRPLLLPPPDEAKRRIGFDFADKEKSK